MINKGSQKTKDRLWQVFADVYAPDHCKSAERRHIRDDVVDIGEIPALLAQSINIPPHALLVLSYVLEWAHAPERFELRV